MYVLQPECIITKHSSALYIGMAKVLPIIDVLGYDGQDCSFILVQTRVKAPFKLIVVYTDNVSEGKFVVLRVYNALDCTTCGYHRSTANLAQQVNGSYPRVVNGL